MQCITLDVLHKIVGGSKLKISSSVSDLFSALGDDTDCALAGCKHCTGLIARCSREHCSLCILSAADGRGRQMSERQQLAITLSLHQFFQVWLSFQKDMEIQWDRFCYHMPYNYSPIIICNWHFIIIILLTFTVKYLSNSNPSAPSKQVLCRIWEAMKIP